MALSCPKCDYLRDVIKEKDQQIHDLTHSLKRMSTTAENFGKSVKMAIAAIKAYQEALEQQSTRLSEIMSADDGKRERENGDRKRCQGSYKAAWVQRPSQ